MHDSVKIVQIENEIRRLESMRPSSFDTEEDYMELKLSILESIKMKLEIFNCNYDEYH